jgi:hypothetical protein
MKLPTNAGYTKLEDDDKEILYQRFCKDQKLNPEIESSVDEFFNSIDQITAETPEELSDE